MNKENTEKLFNDFPLLYRGRNLPVTQSLMAFGFEVGDGWFGLIYDLSKKISELRPDCVAIQVKEKFGGLRFYIGPSTGEVFDAIHKAEEESYTICEKCGSKENVSQTKEGWIKTLCEVCMETKK